PATARRGTDSGGPAPKCAGNSADAPGTLWPDACDGALIHFAVAWSAAWHRSQYRLATRRACERRYHRCNPKADRQQVDTSCRNVRNGSLADIVDAGRSAFPSIADVLRAVMSVCYVPKTDSCTAAK